MRLRQFVFVAERLSPAVEDLCAVLGLEICFRDPGVAEFGIENALMPIGGDFLEVIAPTQAGTAAGRFLDRRGPGGYMMIFQCDDAAGHRQRLNAMGVRSVWQHDQPDAVATHFHPQDWPGAIVSIDTMLLADDWRAEFSDWKWAGPDWRNHVRSDAAIAMTGVEIETADPNALAARWNELMDVSTTTDGLVAADNAAIRFVASADGVAPGVTGLMIEAADPATIQRNADTRGLPTADNHVTVCGVRLDLQAHA
jgi:hypothetical protein